MAWLLHRSGSGCLDLQGSGPPPTLMGAVGNIQRPLTAEKPQEITDTEAEQAPVMQDKVESHIRSGTAIDIDAGPKKLAKKHPFENDAKPALGDTPNQPRNGSTGAPRSIASAAMCKS